MSGQVQEEKKKKKKEEEQKEERPESEARKADLTKTADLIEQLKEKENQDIFSDEDLTEMDKIVETVAEEQLERETEGGQ